MKIIKIHPVKSGYAGPSQAEFGRVNKNKIISEQIGLIADFLNRGKVIVYPTDTIYGLGCLASDKKAIQKIFKIKKRETKKPLLILVNSIAMVKRYCHINREQADYLKKVWPGAVSVILRSRDILPKELTGGGDSLAVRLPKDDFLIKIIKKIGSPLVSTSVNISGEKNLNSLVNIENYFTSHKPDLIIDAGIIKGKPSMLIDLRDMKDIKILRK